MTSHLDSWQHLEIVKQLKQQEESVRMKEK